MSTRIDVMRHGEPVGGRRYRGHSIDDPLTEKGWEQMRNAIPERPPWNVIISSPLSRCLDFSKELADKCNVNLEIDDAIKEIGFGAWEGLTPEEISRDDENALKNFFADPVNNRPNGAEPLNKFSRRIWDTYLTYSKKFNGKHILLITHAGVARAIVANTLGMSLDDVYRKLKIEYGAIISSIIEENATTKILISGT